MLDVVDHVNGSVIVCAVQISQLLGTIRAEAAVGKVSSPVAKQAGELQKTLIHEANMAPQAHANPQL